MSRANGLILITYDEWGGATPNDHREALIAVGPKVRPGIYAGGPFTHYSPVRTLEDGYHLRGYLLASATARPISQIWRH